MDQAVKSLDAYIAKLKPTYKFLKYIRNNLKLLKQNLDVRGEGKRCLCGEQSCQRSIFTHKMQKKGDEVFFRRCFLLAFQVKCKQNEQTNPKHNAKRNTAKATDHVAFCASSASSLVGRSNGNQSLEPVRKKMLASMRAGARCHWCHQTLIFLSHSGALMYSPDQPEGRDADHYKDGWVDSCWACQRLFNDMNVAERKELIEELAK